MLLMRIKLNKEKIENEGRFSFEEVEKKLDQIIVSNGFTPHEVKGVYMINDDEIMGALLRLYAAVDTTDGITGNIESWESYDEEDGKVDILATRRQYGK